MSAMEKQFKHTKVNVSHLSTDTELQHPAQGQTLKGECRPVHG